MSRSHKPKKQARFLTSASSQSENDVEIAFAHTPESLEQNFSWKEEKKQENGAVIGVGWDEEMAPGARQPSRKQKQQSPISYSSSNGSGNGRQRVDLDDSSLISLSDDEFDEEDDNFLADEIGNTSAALKKDDVHNIPGSPWAKPRSRHSKRPAEALAIAKYASTLGFMLTIGWVLYLFIVAVWEYSSLGRVIVEVFLAILTFFGLFWNTYFTASSIFKCFIPAKCFKENSKYFSIVPEKKNPEDEWLSVTIQIPVYKEGLDDVLGPTLDSCIRARDHYQRHTGASCNIVVCDDGMMSFLRDNFSAAEMLWENINETKGRLPIKPLLKRVPRAARRHLAGLRSKNIIEVFHRMLYYYHHDIGFCARHTLDRRGKFKKASNLNTHLKLVFGAQQVMDASAEISFEDACHEVAHNEDGSRDVMYGGNVNIGDLMVLNDADARMQPPVIYKTVPEFTNDKKLGFTQHATKTMDEQRGESYYLRLLETYTDALYQGHFLLSSIMGCHPPLVGHSVFLRTAAIRQCGRMRMLRRAQHWLSNIGLPFLGVDQVGFVNLQEESRTEFWSETHVSEDFELMIHLYNIGYTGRYVAFPDCEFQEGVTRTFDEEAGRHRKFSLGAHELMFNPIQDWLGHGVFTQLFKNFLTCDIPSYYKIFLTAYLQSYTSGGVYILVFLISAIIRFVDFREIETLWAFSPAAIIIFNVFVYYVVGYTTFLIALCRMHKHNKDIFFPEYRVRSKLYLVFRQLRHTMWFQLQFYTVMGNYFFLGGLDHLMSNPRICGATNKDALTITRWVAFKDVAHFNSGSWFIALVMACVSVGIIWQDLDYTYDYESLFAGDLIPSLGALLYAVPTICMSLMAFLVPLFLNPYVTGCYRREVQREVSQDHLSVLGSVDAETIATKHTTRGRSSRTIDVQKKKAAREALRKSQHSSGRSLADQSYATNRIERPLLLQGVSI